MSIDYNPADRPPPRDQTSDTDRDGIADWREYYETGTDPLAWDSDGDGWSDGLEERFVHTDPNIRDTDRDGLSDRDEGMVHRTDPNDADTDSDGLRDGLEGVLSAQHRWSADSLLASTVTTAGAVSAAVASPEIAADPVFDELDAFEAVSVGPSFSELAAGPGLAAQPFDSPLLESEPRFAASDLGFETGAQGGPVGDSAAVVTQDETADDGSGFGTGDAIDTAATDQVTSAGSTETDEQVEDVAPEPEPESGSEDAYAAADNSATDSSSADTGAE